MRNLKRKNNSRGFIWFVVIFAMLVLLISALKINIRGYVDSSSGQALKSNIALIKDTAKIIWTNYILRPILYIWNTYIVPFMKGQFLSGLKSKIQEGSTLSK